MNLLCAQCNDRDLYNSPSSPCHNRRFSQVAFNGWRESITEPSRPRRFRFRGEIRLNTARRRRRCTYVRTYVRTYVSLPEKYDAVVSATRVVGWKCARRLPPSVYLCAGSRRARWRQPWNSSNSYPRTSRDARTELWLRVAAELKALGFHIL